MGDVDLTPQELRKERLLREDGMAFFGRILASTTHEINNVLSIVDQSGGLIEDLLAAAARGRELSPEQLESAVQRIQNQTERGLDMVRRLNKFAHTADRDARSLEVTETLQNLVSLIRRLADLKKIELQFSPGPEAVQLSGSPYNFQQAVFRVYEVALEVSEPGDTIAITDIYLADDVLVELALTEGRSPGPEERLKELDTVVGAIGATIETTTENNRSIIRLRFPRRS